MQVKENIRALQTQRNVKSDEKNQNKKIWSIYGERESSEAFQNIMNIKKLKG